MIEERSYSPVLDSNRKRSGNNSRNRSSESPNRDREKKMNKSGSFVRKYISKGVI